MTHQIYKARMQLLHSTCTYGRFLAQQQDLDSLRIVGSYGVRRIALIQSSPVTSGIQQYSCAHHTPGVDALGLGI